MDTLFPSTVDLPDTDHIQHDVQTALQEDLGSGDLSASLVRADQCNTARVLARESALLCGAPWLQATVLALDPLARIHWLVQEGERCAPGQTVVEIWGQTRALLAAERTALNFLQLLSGVATRTALYVDAVAGTAAQILDTRKTLPGLRTAQKYAVRVGGGRNHRMGLYDAVLLKENHIAAARGVRAALAWARTLAVRPAFVQIEVETLAQLQEALEAGAGMVLLDNMELADLQAAVLLNGQWRARSKTGGAQLEVSGGVTLERVRELAQTGVDRISIGSLTKDVKAVDYSMRFEGL